VRELWDANLEWCDGRDYAASATLRDLKSLDKVLDFIKSEKIYRMLDCGCGYGGLCAYISKRLAIDEVHGIDINEKRLHVARSRGIIAHKVDLNIQAFPFPSSYFDLVTSFGVIEHLIFYDNFLREAYRVLKKDGFFILSMPNLGSYVNRVALLFGYQPRDVEISQAFSPGIMPMYKKEQGIFHLHSATLRAIKELLTFYNFHIILTVPLMPTMTSSNKLYSSIMYALDKTIGRIPSLSRRIVILARK